MQQSTAKKTSNMSKSIPKSTAQKSSASKNLAPGLSKNKQPTIKYKIDAVTRDNFDIGNRKENIT